MQYFSRIVIKNKTFEFGQLLLQVMFVGMVIGLFRTVVPALSESRFNVPVDAFILLGSFIVIFGVIKGLLNFAAGRASDIIGRRKLLVSGWIVALPIPWILAYATDWLWIIVATVLLSINQGFCWSMSQIMKLDIAKREYHGTAIGLNETFGYCGVAIAGYLSAEMTIWLGITQAMLWMGLTIIGLALLLASLFCDETKLIQDTNADKDIAARDPSTKADWKNIPMITLCAAGLVEKFVDTLMWLIYPFFLYQQGVPLAKIGMITGVYGFVWGISQLFTGGWSDKKGRVPLIVAGMTLCAIACSATLLSMHFFWWIINAAVAGLGMAMLYPTLSAAVSDCCLHPEQRGTILGIYRFWRDFGYCIGALALTGIITFSGEIKTGFWLTTITMLISALSVFILVPMKKPEYS